jgi:hypothetical protein
MAPQPHVFRPRLRGMDHHISFAPPPIAFDAQLADALLDTPPVSMSAFDPSIAPANRRSPFESYSRSITVQGGGILITYQDQAMGMPYTILRVFAWTAATALAAWLIFIFFGLEDEPAYATLGFFAVLHALIVRRKLKQRHTVEIQPDCMIIDGTDVFLAEDIGENYPQLTQAPGSPGQASISGTCGTRLIEYMSCNKLSDADRTPEVLAAHLKEAMEQLWARRELTFPDTY